MHEPPKRAALFATLAALAWLGAALPAQAAVTQPRQASSGPGGKEYAHRDWRVHKGGSGADAFYVFEPSKPRPRKAPLAIVTHGYFEFSGYASFSELIRHTVRKGSVVIYPRWQTGGVEPCPGPFDIEPCITSAVAGIRGGLKYLRGTGHVKPLLRRTSYFGFSFGGIVTANMTNRYKALGLPRPRAIFLEDPHDGGLDGPGEPALDDSLAGIPSGVKLQCHSSANGVTSEAGKEGSSCNAVFPKLAHIPAANKDLVMIRPDSHGTPALTAEHGVCTAPKGEADAYDFNFCWKTWDALRSCAYANKDCRYALGDTPQHRGNGRWSDGTPIVPLKIQDAAPIAP